MVYVTEIVVKYVLSYLIVHEVYDQIFSNECIKENNINIIYGMA